MIGTYPRDGDWIEVHCEARPRGCGRLHLRRVGPHGEGVVSIARRPDYLRLAWAVKAGESLVLARGGQLGQHAVAMAGGRVEPNLARALFGAPESTRWLHLGSEGESPPGAA